MPVIRHADVAAEPFKGGATYRTLVGDGEGSTPIRLGVQTSPPGYATPTHSHPYMETVTVLEGAGEAWIEGSDSIVALAPGTTCVFPANTPHWFRATGDAPLVTLGVHASPNRIVDVRRNAADGAGGASSVSR
jgi:quercetin dioxygenase-like cupin family protein